MKDYYKILGLEHSASSEEIKKACWTLAHEFHPDKSGGNEDKFKEINEAYQILSDEMKRAQYDRFGTAESTGGGFPNDSGDTSSKAICPQCHFPVILEWYFCPNCGKDLKPKPPDISLLAQIKVYAVSILLPPFGLVYVWKYYRQPDKKSQQIALIALVITIVMTVATVWLTIGAINSANQALSNALNGTSGL